MTLRHGDLVDEIGNRHYCEFDDEPHMYFNAGAARIPSTHRNLLAYCKELEIELEVFVNENKTSFFQDDNMLGGMPIRNIDYTTNMRGFMAEFMAKAMTEAELDSPFTDPEAETLLGMIRSFGDLSENNLYKGSFRAGYAQAGFWSTAFERHDSLPGFAEVCLRASGYGRERGETGPILMQPVGGMDKIDRC